MNRSSIKPRDLEMYIIRGVSVEDYLNGPSWKYIYPVYQRIVAIHSSLPLARIVIEVPSVDLSDLSWK